MTEAPPFERFRSGIVFPALLLGVLALIAAATLSLGDQLTRDAIRDRAAEDLRISISQVIPAEPYNNNLVKDTMVIDTGPDGEILVYRARQDGVITAVAFQTTEPGYGGDIKVMLGIATDGTLLGVRVISHSETPGLGDKIEVRKSRWIFGFNHLSMSNLAPGEWKVKKDGGHFDQFSGATISPRAVVNAVKKGLDLFAAHREQLLNPETGRGQ